MNDDDREIRSILESLEQAPAGPGPPDEETETLARLYAEVLGLLPHELEPVEPRPGTKEHLLAAISQGLAEPAPPLPPPAEPKPEPRAARPPSGPLAVPRPPTRRPSRWPLALAATVAFLALGLAVWLFYGLSKQDEAITRLTRELSDERTRTARAEAKLAQADRDFAELLRVKEQLRVVTSPAVEVSAMRPVGSEPRQPGARGVLFVAADHQHWYLCLEGLAPAPQGKAYVLWFVAGDNPVASGNFTASAGGPVELRADRMPTGTQQVVVTLEDDPKAQRPAGPEVLQAGDLVQIL